MDLSTLDLEIIIGVAGAILAIFFGMFFYLDKKVDDLKDDLNECKMELGTLENRLETLNPIIAYIKEVGEKNARETFEAMKKVKG